MKLKKLSLLNYKNFDEIAFDFESKLNFIVGQNGIGKTNVLDAIYHLAYGKSYFNPLAIQNIKHDQDFFVIEGEFEKNERPENIVCSLKKGQKKVVKHNGKIYDRLSEHIGLIPLVMISPSDRDLIMEGSETRRGFIDIVISQLNNSYLIALIKYHKTLKQRNSLLKFFSLNHTFDADNLAIYDEQLHELGHYIYDNRKLFLTEFTPIFNKHHQNITNAKDDVQLVYESQLHTDTLASLLKKNNSRDRLLQHTSFGIHKDDLSFEINHYPIKKFGSQGQQKSYLIALKLAQFDFLKKQSGVKPILLFDDVFDKLDETRVSKIVAMVNNDDFGQLFVTDTHPDRIESLLKTTYQKHKIFNL